MLLTKRDSFFTKPAFQQMVCILKQFLLKVAQLYGCLYNINPQHMIRTPVPAICKPVELWTGKQLVSFTSHTSTKLYFQISAILDHLTIGMPALSMESNTKIAGTVWGKGGSDPALRPPIVSNYSDMSTVWPGSNENIVVVSKNEMLSGVLDKSQCGASAYGLIHVL